MKTFTSSWLALGLSAAFAMHGVAAQASDLSYSFTGVVLDDEAERGWTNFSGSFTFSDSVLDGIPDTSTAAYAHAGAPYGMTVTFDGTDTVTINQVFNILISNNLGGMDELGALAQNNAHTRALGLTLTDFNQSIFASDALPLPAGGLKLSDFGWSSFYYEAPAGRLQGQLTSFACSTGCNVAPPLPVPEPGTWVLLLAGLVGISARVRRYTQH